MARNVVLVSRLDPGELTPVQFGLILHILGRRGTHPKFKRTEIGEEDTEEIEKLTCPIVFRVSGAIRFYESSFQSHVEDLGEALVVRMSDGFWVTLIPHYRPKS